MSLRRTLALYGALSACRTSCSVSVPGRQAASPKLACTRREKVVDLFQLILDTAADVHSQLGGPVLEYQTELIAAITEGSPSTDFLPQHLRHQPQAAIPCKWPRVSLSCLKWSRSIITSTPLPFSHSRAIAWLRRPGCADQSAHPAAAGPASAAAPVWRPAQPECVFARSGWWSGW